MVSQVSQNSIDSYYQGGENYETQRALVLKTIKGFKFPVCDAQIVNATELDINVVTARRNKLMNLGLVKEAFKGKSPYTGRRVSFWS